MEIIKLVPDSKQVTYELNCSCRIDRRLTLHIEYIVHFNGNGSSDKDTKVYDACGGEFWGKLCKKTAWNVHSPHTGFCIEHWIRNARSTDADERCHAKIQGCLKDIGESLRECRDSGGAELEKLSALILRRMPGVVEQIDPNFNPRFDCHVKHIVHAKEAGQTSKIGNSGGDAHDDGEDEDDEDESSDGEMDTDEDQSEENDGDADKTGKGKQAGRP